MAMLSYQHEVALYKLNQILVKNNTDFDYFEMLDLFRQLEQEGFVKLNHTKLGEGEFTVQKTDKGQYYNYNWLNSEFR